MTPPLAKDDQPAAVMGLAGIGAGIFKPSKREIHKEIMNDHQAAWYDDAGKHTDSEGFPASESQTMNETLTAVKTALDLGIAGIALVMLWLLWKEYRNLTAEYIATLKIVARLNRHAEGDDQPPPPHL